MLESPVWENIRGDVREKAMITANPNLYSEENKQKETIAVIVLSYNRPKMLRETLASIKGADEVIIVDDGSDFDPIEAVNDVGVDVPVKIMKAKPAPLEIRINQPRLGKLINAALRSVSSTLVTYICDDDIMGPEWLTKVKKWMHDRPGCHLVKGDVLYFTDDIKDTRKAQMDGRGLTSGNLAHRIECCKKEHVFWYEHKLDSIDDAFFWEMHKHHNTWMIPYINCLALCRRVHPNALSAFCEGFTKHDDGKKIMASIAGGISKEGKKKLNNQKWME